MGRPYRPNPSDAARGTTARNNAHVPQESASERKARKRAEAIDRDDAHRAEGSPRAKKKRIAAKKAAA